MLCYRLKWEHWLKRNLLLGAIAVVSLVLAGCGSSKTAECREILRTIQHADAQLSLGEQTHAKQQADAQLYQTLADDLMAMNIRSKALQDHQTQLAEAYRSRVAAIHQYIEVSNEEGHLSYREGDTDAEAAVNAVLAEQMRTRNKIDLAMGLFYNTCSR